MLLKPPSGISNKDKLPELAWPLGAIYKNSKFEVLLCQK